MPRYNFYEIVVVNTETGDIKAEGRTSRQLEARKKFTELSRLLRGKMENCNLELRCNQYDYKNEFVRTIFRRHL